MTVFVFYESFFKFYVSLEHRSVGRLLMNRYIAAYLLVFGFALLVHKDTQNNFKVPELWTANVKNLCGIKDGISIDPETANFEKVYNSLGAILGIYVGAIVDLKYFKMGKYARYYETDFVT